MSRSSFLHLVLITTWMLSHDLNFLPLWYCCEGKILLTDVYCTSLASLCFVKESHCQLAFPVLRAREAVIWKLTVFFNRPVADPRNILGKPLWILPCNWLLSLTWGVSLLVLLMGSLLQLHIKIL